MEGEIWGETDAIEEEGGREEDSPMGGRGADEVTSPTMRASERRGGAVRSPLLPGERRRGQDNGEMGEIRQA